MTRACALTILTLGCGPSGHWVAQSGADANASGRCYAQAEAATDTYGCKGYSQCISENIRWGNIYDGCMRGSGYAWLEDAPKPRPKPEPGAESNGCCE